MKKSVNRPTRPRKPARDRSRGTRGTRPKSSREKVNAHRQRMRRRGMKLVQIWVPDPSSPNFAAQAAQQARAVAGSAHEKEEQAFIDSVTDWEWK